MKKIIAYTTLAVLSLSFETIPAIAEQSPPIYSVSPSHVLYTPPTGDSTTASISPTNPLLNRIEKTSENQQTRLTKIITKADTFITERINALNAVVADINKGKYGSSAQASQVITSLNTQIQGMQTLKTQIDSFSSTSEISTTLLPLVKEIFSNFKIYGSTIPWARSMMHMAVVQKIYSNLQIVEQNMLQDISFAQSKNLSTTQLQADEAKFAADVTKLNTDMSSVQNQINALAPSATNAETTPIAQNLMKIFAQIHQDVEATSADYKTFVKDFKSLFGLGDITSVSQSPTETLPTATGIQESPITGTANSTGRTTEK